MAATVHRTSGDVTADRRYAYGVGLMSDGDAAGAAELFEQTLELVPDWAAAWFALAQARENTGQIDAAIDALRRSLVCDPADGLGAALHLARLGQAEAPARPPEAYVRDLFDAYAPTFDAALVGTLGYRAPELIVAALERCFPGRSYSTGLDLGCGTGLMAAALGPRVPALDGVDLSAAMVTIARDRGLYQHLAVDDIVADMAARPAGSVELITAADVFCYLGDLQPALDQASRLLPASGVLAFSVELMLLPQASSRFRLRDSLRYDHSEHYLADTARAAGLELTRMEQQTLRTDRGLPIVGVVAILSKPSAPAGNVNA